MASNSQRYTWKVCTTTIKWDIFQEGAAVPPVSTTPLPAASFSYEPSIILISDSWAVSFSLIDFFISVLFQDVSSICSQRRPRHSHSLTVLSIYQWNHFKECKGGLERPGDTITMDPTEGWASVSFTKSMHETVHPNTRAKAWALPRAHIR